MAGQRRLIEAVEVTDDEIYVVRLKRIFDASSLSEFEKVLAYMLARDHYKIVVDLTNVEFISSAGWGAFTAELRQVRDNGGDIRLAAMNPDVLDVFLLLELDSFINAFDTVEEAILSFDTASAAHKQREAEEKLRAPDEVAGPGVESEELPAPLESSAGDESAIVADEFAEAPEDDSSMAYSADGEEPDADTGEDLSYDEPATWSPDDEYTTLIQDPSVGTPSFPPAAPQTERSDQFEPAADEDFFPDEYRETFAAADGRQAGDSFPDDREMSAAGADLDSPSSQHAGAGELDGWSDETGIGDEPEDELSEPPDSEVSHQPDDRRQFAGPGKPRPQFEQETGEFEMQDIHDPWMLDEIDTLPEENEMDEIGWESTVDFDEEPVSNQHSPFVERQQEPDMRPSWERDSQQVPAEPREALDREPAAPVARKDAQRAGRDLVSQPPAQRRAPSRPRETRGKALPGVPGRPAPRPPTRSAPLSTTGSRRPSSPPGSPPKIPFAQPGWGAPPAGPRPIRAQQAPPRIRLAGDRKAILRQIVSKHPQYGPTMLGKFLETRIDPPIKVSRSTIYRWLRECGLNTRDRRMAYAGRVVTA